MILNPPSILRMLELFPSQELPQQVAFVAGVCALADSLALHHPATWPRLLDAMMAADPDKFADYAEAHPGAAYLEPMTLRVRAVGETVTTADGWHTTVTLGLADDPQPGDPTLTVHHWQVSRMPEPGDLLAIRPPTVAGIIEPDDPGAEIIADALRRAQAQQAEADAELIESLPDLAFTHTQRHLEAESGTPRQFARRVLAAIGGTISRDEALAAIENYRSQWLAAV